MSEDLRKNVDQYARDDLDGGLQAHVAFFDFLSDPDLQQRVGEEYFTARYVYKLFEGLRVEENWARRAQVQLQVQQYASIYEACLHHLLFDRAAGSPEVGALLELQTLKHWSVSGPLRDRLDALPGTNGRKVVAAIESTIALGPTKVRFDSKARAAKQLGIIEDELCEQLIEFYTARNMIHIHAELKKGANWTWEIEFAKQSYWRLAAFAEQARRWVANQTA